MFPRLKPLFKYVGSPCEFLHSTFVNGVYESHFESSPPIITGLGPNSSACLLSPRGIALNPSLAVHTSFSFSTEHDILDSVELLNQSLDNLPQNNEQNNE